MAAFFRRLYLYDGLVEAWGETLRVFHHARNILVFGQDVAILLLSLALTLKAHDRAFCVENRVGLIPMLLCAIGK